MDFRQLRYFAHVARAGSFKRAAAELRIAQPALSRQVRKLEEELGVDLLARHGRGARLTNSGAILLDGAEAIAKLVAETGERVKGGSSPTGEHLTLGVPPATGLLLVPTVISRLRTGWPELALHVREGIGSLIQEWLFDGRVDIGLVHNPLPLDGLEIQPILTERMVIIGPRRRGERGLAKTLRIRDLADMPLIMPSLPHNNRRLLEQAAVQHGIRLHTVLEVDSVVLTKALVQAGHGYSLITYAAVHDDVARGELAVHPIERPPLMSTLAIATLRGVRMTPAATALIRQVRASLRELIETGAWRCAPGPIRGAPTAR